MVAPPGVAPSGTTEVSEVSLGLLGLPFTGGAPQVLQMVRDAMVAQPCGNVRGGATAGPSLPGRNRQLLSVAKIAQLATVTSGNPTDVKVGGGHGAR
jgi:hypothetical protein